MRNPNLLWLKAKILAHKVVRVNQALVRKEISRYPYFLEAFERRYAAWIGRQFGLSFCNGTSAIEAALFAANVQPGDEVIVPACTFHASITPILNVGAIPVFADVDAHSLTLDPAEVVAKLTPKTKAVIVVHIWGMPANLKAIRQAIADRDIVLIEDVSHAHGASYDGQPCGAWGDFGVFSLQGSKTVAAGEGGIVVTDSWEHYIRMSAWGHFSRHGQHFASVGLGEFAPTGIGYKRRMAPLGALLADVDLNYLATFNQIKRRHVAMLDQELGDLDGIALVHPPELARRGSFYQGYPIRIVAPGVTANEVIAALAQVGIQASPYPFALHHRLPVYTDAAFRHALLTQQAPPSPPATFPALPVTESLQSQLLLLSPNYLLELDRRTLRQLKQVLGRLSPSAFETKAASMQANAAAKSY